MSARGLAVPYAIAVVLAMTAQSGVGSVQAADAAPSSATWPAMAEHAEAVASYTLRAKLDPVAHTVHGEGTITWRNASSKAVTELWMHLYLNAFKNQSSVFMRTPIGGFRGTTVPKTWGMIDVTKLVLVDGEARHDLKPGWELRRPNDEDETDARIPLPREIASGGSITLEIEWDDKLPSIVERTGFEGSFHMVAQWFPKLARLEDDGTWAHFPFHHLGEFYSDYGRYDVTLDVPEAFVLGATGPATETKTEGGRRIERHVQEDIHDFAWTAWDKWQTKKETIDGVAVTVLHPPGQADHGERELETMRFALPHYGERYGKYPYSVLTLVHPPEGATEAGGMEYPTLITTGSSQALLPRGIHLVEAVTIHEFGHQYFYGLLASNEDAWPFLDEGVNQYAEGEGMAAWKGAGSGIDIFGLKVGDLEFQADRSRHFVHDERVAQGAAHFASGGAYGALVYARTASTLATLARVYGKPKLDRALGVYARRHRFKHPSPTDLVAAVKEEVGPGAAENLKKALFEKGWVDYAITQMSSHPSRGPAGVFDKDGKRETVTTESTLNANHHDGWALVVRRGTLSFPVEIELVSENGARVRVQWDGEGETFRAPYSGTSPLVSVVVDPDDRVLVDQRLENNQRSRIVRGAPRIMERATYWMGALLGGLAP